MRTTEIKIVPIGSVNNDLLDYLSLTVPASFNSRCNQLKLSLAATDAYDPGRRQYSSSQLLAKLLELEVEDNCRVLGVTEVDLFLPVLTFVFGQAQLGGRAALVSAHRLHPQFYGLPEDRRLFYSRCEKEANHELGHTEGLPHCRSYDCVMHVSNSVEQVDLKPSTFCSSCEGLLHGLASKVAPLGARCL